MRGWRKWHWKAIKRNVLKFIELRKLGRNTEATQVLKTYKGAAFWLVVPLYIILWFVGSPQSCTSPTTKPPVASSPSEPTTDSYVPPIDWTNIRYTALNRTKIKSFSSAKRKLYPLYADLGLQTTFYCNCNYRNKTPDLSSCGVVPKKNVKRMNRTEAEHIVPASLIGHTLECWDNGGRKNCGKVDPFFKRAEGDLHNLVPALGEINGNRSNYPPVENIPGEVRNYGNCDVEISRKKFEPPADKRGDIGRIYLYMAKVYNAPLTSNQIEMFTRWNENDPPTRNEIAIHEAKAKIQGNRNPYYN